MIQSVLDNKVAIITALFLLSEILSLVPAIKANGVAQMIFGLIAKAKDAVAPAAPAAAPASEAPKA